MRRPLTQKLEAWAVLLLSCVTLAGSFGRGTACAAEEESEPPAPQLVGVRPLAITPGSAVEVELLGPGMDAATALWTSFPAEVTRLDETPAHFRIEVPAGTPVQIGALRAVLADGVTALRPIALDDLVTDAPRTGEKDNDDAKDANDNNAPVAHELSLPTAIEGTLESTATHRFHFRARAGQRVSFEVLAARLGSELDPLLVLTNDQGEELARADDAPSLGGDCYLAITLPADGRYHVLLRDASYGGGDGYRYRLRAGRFPLVRAVFPLAVERHRAATISVLTEDGGKRDVEVRPSDSDEAPRDQHSFGVRRPQDTASAFAAVLRSDLEEILETEPNQPPAETQALSLPCAINGRFATAGDQDRFRLSVAQGEPLSITPRHGTLGIRTRLYLRLYGEDGKLLAESAQAGRSPGTLEHRAQKDETLELAVEELHRRSGPAVVYRLEVRREQRDFELTVDTDHFHAPQAGVSVIAVKAVRNEYKGPIRLSVEGLPGATTSQATIAAEQNETRLQIALPSSLPSGALTALQVVGHAVEDDALNTTSRTTASFEPPWGRAFGHVEFPPDSWRRSLALHVGAPFPPFFDLTTEPRRLWCPPGEDLLAFAVAVERFEGFAGAIGVTLEGAPPSVRAVSKPVRGGRPSTVVRLRGMKALQEGVYPLRLLTSARYKEQPLEIERDPLLVHVGAPIAVEIEPPASGTTTLPPSLRVNVRRFTDDTAPIEIALNGLPPGVRAAAARITGTRRSIDIPLLTEAAQSPRPASLTLTAVATTSIAPPKRFELDAGSLGEQLSASELAERGVLREAESFERGNVTVDRDNYGKGIGIISDPGSQKNFAEYDIELAAAGLYQVELRYAARTSRPGRLLLNGTVVKDDAIREVTGSWTPETQTWFVEGLFPFHAGKNVLRVESEPMMSHIDKVLVVRPASMRRLEATFDSWVVEGNSVTAEGLDGNMISVFSSDNEITGKKRVGLIEFDAGELTEETIASVHLEIAVDGREGPLAVGPVYSLARLLPDDTDVRKLNATAYAELAPRADALDALGHYAIAEGRSLPAGEFESSARASVRDLALLTRRLAAGQTRWVFALEALEDGNKTARDWGADDAPPKGTHGGPLPPRLVVRLADGDERPRVPSTFVAKSRALKLTLGGDGAPSPPAGPKKE